MTGPALRFVVFPAVRFVEPKKMPRSTEVEVLRLSVLDTGLGVPEPAWTLQVRVPETLQSTISVYSVSVVTDEPGRSHRWQWRRPRCSSARCSPG
jgi:hypothetical protein